MSRVTEWSIIECELAYQVAMHIARGCYQRGLLAGYESLSGSTLRGKAARYRGQYKNSRNNLLYLHLKRAHVNWREDRGPHNRRILVIESIAMASDGSWFVDATTGEAIRARTQYEADYKISLVPNAEVVDGFTYFGRTA